MPSPDRRTLLKVAAALAASTSALALPENAIAGGLGKLDNPQALEMARDFVQQYANDTSVSAAFDKQFEVIAANLANDGSAEQFASDTKKLCKYVNSIVNPGNPQPSFIIIIIIIIIILVCIPKDAK